MPTYSVITSAGRLNSAMKAKIAGAITRIHNAVTGAPGYFAQVIFLELASGNTFIGGVPVEGDQIFVHGQIRDGRTAEQKARLINGILDAVADCAGTPRFHVWTYIVDLAPTQMAEFGHVLPPAGKEDEWGKNLPKLDREKLEAITKRAAELV